MNRVVMKAGGRIGKGGLWTMMLAASLLALTACGGGDDGGGGTGVDPGNGNPPPSGAANEQFAYVINAGGANIQAYLLDGEGNLTSVGDPIFTGSFPHHVNVDPRGRFVYVSNHEAPFVSGFRIVNEEGPNRGGLTPINPAPFSPVTGPTDPTENQSHSSVMDQNGEHLYVVAGAEAGASTLRVYTIDNTPANLGALTPVPGQSFPVGVHAHNIAISSNNQFVYVASEGSGEVHAFFRNADGTLAARGSITGLPDASAVTVDQGNRFVYATYTNAVEVFRIETDGATSGSLRRIEPTSAFQTGSGPHSLAMHPNGQFLYVANINANTINVFRIDADSGALTEIQSPRPATGIDPNYTLVHPNGRFLYTADAVSDQLSRYSINEDGTLTPAGTIRAGDGTNGIGTTKFE